MWFGRKRLVLALIVATVTMLSLSCALGDGCSHKWKTERTISKASCTQEGNEEQKCSLCGAVRTKRVQALGHSWGNWTVTQNATCTKEGSRQRRCSRCDASNTGTIPAAHDFEDWIDDKVVTCTDEGIRHHTCKVCHETATQIVEPLGHEWKIQTKPDCTNQGEQTCKRCGTVEQIPANGHNWRVSKKANCKQTGLQVCRVCKTSEVLPVTDHTWRITSAATCFRTGSQICTVCRITEVIPRSEHSWTVKKEPTCTESGIRECTVAKCRQTEELSALGHERIVSVQAEEPTCLTSGQSEGCKCARCGSQLETSEVLLALGHSYDIVRITEASEEHDGYTLHRCVRCGDEYQDEIVQWFRAEHIPVQLLLQDGTTVTPERKLVNSTNLYCSSESDGQPLVQKCTLQITRDQALLLQGEGVENVYLSISDTDLYFPLEFINSPYCHAIEELLGNADSVWLTIDPLDCTVNIALRCGETSLSVYALVSE